MTIRAKDRHSCYKLAVVKKESYFVIINKVKVNNKRLNFKAKRIVNQ
jgi:hypothetical protein